jgi:hypothetical protein
MSKEMEAARKFQLGSIISGTLKTEDLLHTFAEELRYRIVSEGRKPPPSLGVSQRNGHNTVGRQLLTFIKASSFLSDASKWDITHQPESAHIKPEYQELAEQLVEALQDALNEACPPLVYFGNTPDDDTCFGFWLDHDALQEELSHGEATHNEDTKYLPNFNVFVSVSDLSNITIYDPDRNELWSFVES